MRSYRLLAGTTALSLAASSAFGDPLTVSTATTTAVATKTAANNTPGDVTVAKGGSVTVSTGPAATINSANALTNNGTISSSASTGGVGVLIDGTSPFKAFTFTQNGIVSVTGTATGAAGNIGINIVNGPVAGTIGFPLLSTSTITVTGDNALGVSINAPFTGDIALRSIGVTGANSSSVALTQVLSGNLSLFGTNSSTGAGGYGVNIAAPIVGQFNNGGIINVGGSRTFDARGNSVAGNVGLAGVRVSASVSGGIVNDLYYADPTTGARQASATTVTGTTTVNNTLATGTITTTGDAPAIWVAPTATGGAVAIGAVGSGTDAYAVINRGALTVSVAKAGLAAEGIRIGGGGGGAATTLAGGIDSQVSSSIAVSSADAMATGIHLLAGANVPTILNEGALSVASSQSAAVGKTPVGNGGNAFGIVIDTGATLTSLTNSGTIAVQGVGSTTTAAGTVFASASGIVDRSGTLGLINNTGTITTLSGGAATAIDLTGSNGRVTVANSGTIRGDILFGSGPSTLALSGGTLAGTVKFGAGPSVLALSNTAVFANGFTATNVDVTLADTAVLDLTKGPTTLNSITAASISPTGKAILVVPVTPGGAALNVTGAASFTGKTSVRLSLQSLAANQNLAIIQAGGGITTDHLQTLVDASSAPYLFTATAPTITGNTLSISLARKSAADIGLTGGQALLYTNSILALANSPAESSAIANLSSQAAVVAAYRQLTPPSFGRAALRAAQALSDGGFGAAAERLNMVDELRHGGKKGLGVWLQEFGDFNSQRAGANELGFDESSFGLAGGIDRPLLGLDAVGIAAVSNWVSVRQGRTPGNASTPIHIQTQGVEPYASKSFGPLFVQLDGLVAYNRYDSKRLLTFGGLDESVSAKWDGLQYAAGATVGARLSRGRLRFTPSNTISWTQIQQNSYSETGGGAFDLGLAKQTDSATTDTAKVRLAYLLKLIDSSLEFEVHAGYVHQFESKATKTDIHFLTLPGDPFTASGDAVRTEQLSYGGGVGYVQDDFKLKFGYDRRQETGFHDQQLALSAGFSF